MKKVILSFSSIIVFFVSWGQQYAVYVEENCSNVDVNSINVIGGTHSISSNGIESMNVSFYFKNNSGSTQSIQISRSDICVDPAWVNNLIWEPACNDPQFNGMHVNDAAINNAWQSQALTIQQDSLARIVAELTFNAVNSNGVYRYYFYASNNLTDSIDLKINGGCYLEVIESKDASGISVYPNPANEQLTVSTFGLTSSALVRLTDISGKIVREEEISSTSILRTDDLKNGVYLVSVLENGNVIQTRRVVVKH